MAHKEFAWNVLWKDILQTEGNCQKLIYTLNAHAPLQSQYYVKLIHKSQRPLKSLNSISTDLGIKKDTVVRLIR